MTNGDYPQIASDFSVFDMLQVRAEPAESVIKKFRRNTCNGDQRCFGGNIRSTMIPLEPAINDCSVGELLLYVNSFPHVISQHHDYPRSPLQVLRLPHKRTAQSGSAPTCNI